MPIFMGFDGGYRNPKNSDIFEFSRPSISKKVVTKSVFVGASFVPDLI
jgi:hypothetical protein